MLQGHVLLDNKQIFEDNVSTSKGAFPISILSLLLYVAFFSILFLFNIGSFVALRSQCRNPIYSFTHSFIQGFYSTDHVLNTILNVLKN